MRFTYIGEVETTPAHTHERRFRGRTSAAILDGVRAERPPATSSSKRSKAVSQKETTQNGVEVGEAR